MALILSQYIPFAVLLIFVKSTESDTPASSKDEIIEFWADRSGMADICPVQTNPIDDSTENHNKIMAVLQEKKWSVAWLSLKKDPSDGQWKWPGNYVPSSSTLRWADGEPVVAKWAQCAVITMKGFWKTTECRTRYNGFCYKNAHPTTWSWTAHKKRVAIAAACVVVIVIIIVILAVLFFIRLQRVRRAAEGNPGATTYKQLDKGTGNTDLLGNQEL